jgi:hypothetical protein
MGSGVMCIAHATDADLNPPTGRKQHCQREPFRIVGSDQLERRTGILEKNGLKAQHFIFNNLLFGSTSTLQRDISCNIQRPHRF